MISIGLRNLRRDRLRMAVATSGVVFAVVLVTLEVGMLLGLVRNASLLVDESRADLWVTTVDVPTFDFALPQAQRKHYLIQAVSGVARVEEFNVAYSIWKLPSGGNANIQVVGLDLHGDLAAPLRLAEGDLRALHNQDAVIIDEGERAKLGGVNLGDWVEVVGHRAKVVGFTRGMRSFTTTPYVFASLPRSELYGWLTRDAIGRRQSTYFLVKTRSGSDLATIRAEIQRRVPDVDVFTREEFSWKTRRYWLFETGVGLGFLAAALLGLLVGGVIVSQALYAMTLERLPEFGVLKAMGASMAELAQVVLEQGMACGITGLALGIGLSLLLGAGIRCAGTSVQIPWSLVCSVSALTFLMCSAASLVSIVRLGRVEPAAVFRT